MFASLNALLPTPATFYRLGVQWLPLRKFSYVGVQLWIGLAPFYSEFMIYWYKMGKYCGVNAHALHVRSYAYNHQLRFVLFAKFYGFKQM
jgi:hypothetical protein